MRNYHNRCQQPDLLRHRRRVGQASKLVETISSVEARPVAIVAVRIFRINLMCYYYVITDAKIGKTQFVRFLCQRPKPIRLRSRTARAKMQSKIHTISSCSMLTPV